MGELLHNKHEVMKPVHTFMHRILHVQVPSSQLKEFEGLELALDFDHYYYN